MITFPFEFKPKNDHVSIAEAQYDGILEVIDCLKILIITTETSTQRNNIALKDSLETRIEKGRQTRVDPSEFSQIKCLIFPYWGVQIGQLILLLRQHELLFPYEQLVVSIFDRCFCLSCLFAATLDFGVSILDMNLRLWLYHLLSDWLHTTEDASSEAIVHSDPEEYLLSALPYQG